MDMINKGAALAGQAGNSAQMWEKIAGATIMSPAGFVITPAQQAEMTLTNRLIQQKTQQMRNNVAAAPDPALQALNQWIEQVGGTIIGAYATGGMSKGGDYKTSYNARYTLEHRLPELDRVHTGIPKILEAAKADLTWGRQI